MGNRPSGENCGNITYTHDCCGLLGYQEICGGVESCFEDDRISHVLYDCKFDWLRDTSMAIWIPIVVTVSL